MGGRFVAARSSRLAAARLPAQLTPAALAVAVATAVLAAVALRLRLLMVPLWGDEAQTVGLAQHSLSSLPGLMRLDGAPPLYYALLHVWMAVFGHGAAAGHALSAVVGIALVPVTAWGAWLIGGRWPMVYAAALAATDRFVTLYSDEIRMYTLVVLLSLIGTVALVCAGRSGKARWWVALGVSVAALMYTHYWGLYFACGVAVGAVVGLMLYRPPRSFRGPAIAAGTVATLFAVWVPTLLYQAKHTGAPWLAPPTVHGAVVDVRVILLGGTMKRYDVVGVALLAAGAVALFRAVRSRETDLRPIAVIVAIIAVTLLIAFAVSSHKPSWFTPYLAPTIGPFILLAALIAARTGTVGAFAVLVAVVAWGATSTTRQDIFKSNIEPIIAAVGTQPPGSLFFTSPGASSLVSYYLPHTRYASVEGPLTDPTVFDWRDAERRLTMTNVTAHADSILRRIPTGAHLVVITSRLGRNGYAQTVAHAMRAFQQILSSDRHFILLRTVTARPGDIQTYGATVYRKTTAKTVKSYARP